MPDRFLVRMFGTEKSYIIFKIQLAIILSVAVSILYSLFKGYWQAMQLIPFALLLLSSIELRRKYRRDFLPYFLMFLAIFLLVLITPFLFQYISITPSNPAELLRYGTYAILAILVLLVLSRGLALKREIHGKVVLADKDTAVIEADMDLFAGIRAGKYVVKNAGAKKGDLVRVSVKKGFFKGAYPYKIMGKVIL